MADIKYLNMIYRIYRLIYVIYYSFQVYKKNMKTKSATIMSPLLKQSVRDQDVFI
jgi:hypothetical protein